MRKSVEYQCPKCEKKEQLKYPTFWYRTRKGTGFCNSCSKAGGNNASFKKGKVSWNKGLLGYHLGVPRWFPKGDKNPAWKGGVTSESTKIRNSKEYALWRMSVFERDDFTCQICLQKGGKLNADHIKPFSKFPELRLDLDNGRTLCLDCHKQTDTYLSKAYSYGVHV